MLQEREKMAAPSREVISQILQAAWLPDILGLPDGARDSLVSQRGSVTRSIVRIAHLR